ncbi:unnamed protein product [Tuber aestivum]|uniref:Uncharacterized protein n=1 Tax=Tuber aestivum TaxID=59557 RepID=A0A292Q7U6_9PEZI|nr:unnamed protein product [Tuber aestivum]
MSQHYRPRPASTIEVKSSQSTAGSLLGIHNSKVAPASTIPTSVEFSDVAKVQTLRLPLGPLPIESSNNTAELNTNVVCAGEEATICHDSGDFRAVIGRTNQDEEDEGEAGGGGYVFRLSAHAEGLNANRSTSGRQYQKSTLHRRSREGRSQASISADPEDLTSRIADWIPLPPELPLSPKLLDPAIAAAYPLPPSRACSEPTPSTQQPPYQLPPYPAVPHSTASPSSLLHGASPRNLPRLKVPPSLASSSTTDMTWGPDSPLTSALRLKRAAAVSALLPSSPTHSMSSQDSSSTRVTDVEAELGALEEVGRTEVLRQRVLLWRLIAERDGGGGIECATSG